MSLVQTVDQIEYPESDGKPMGETDLHRDWMFRILEILRLRYRDQRVYVASDLLVYYEEGDPTKFVVPDDFVVKDCEPGRRRTFKIWEEGKSPDVVFEVTSRGSKREDQIFKPQIYARLGVKEYFSYDPTADYLNPPLQGHRLERKAYARIEPDEAGLLRCEELDICLRLEEGDLVMYDGRSGDVLHTEAEAERMAREAETMAREAERVAREAAEAARDAAQSRAAELEAELQRLREQLKRGRRDN